MSNYFKNLTPHTLIRQAYEANLAWQGNVHSLISCGVIAQTNVSWSAYVIVCVIPHGLIMTLCWVKHGLWQVSHAAYSSVAGFGNCAVEACMLFDLHYTAVLSFGNGFYDSYFIFLACCFSSVFMISTWYFSLVGCHCCPQDSCIVYQNCCSFVFSINVAVLMSLLELWGCIKCDLLCHAELWLF